MSDVFISYAQRAPEPTHALATALVEHGIDAWFDVNLLPGEAFGKVLDGEIDRAKAVVTIWSRPALTSTWVPAESQRALDQSKLLCVRTPDVDAKELPTPFNRLHTPLVTDIEAILGGLAAKGLRRGKASISGLQAEHGSSGEAAIAWHSIKDSSELFEIETFLEVYYAAAFYRLLATRKLERLKGRPVAPPGPAPPPRFRPEDVFLRIEAGMHTATIKRISLTADGRMMATGSDDKTVRLWSLPDGKLVRTLRPPIGPGNDGKVYAVALAPDGRWVAAGGWLDTKGDEFVLIFDTATGAVTTRLGPLSGTINDLEVARSGNHLAVGLGGNNGIRVWETKGWRQVTEDRDYGGQVYGLSFAADGRLAVTSFDGHIRLYGADGRLVRKAKAPGGARPFGIAFSPDGARLVVGYQDTTRVDVLSGQTLAHMFSPDTAGVDNGDLSKVTWLADGGRLAAAGLHAAKGEHPIFAWADGGKGTRQALPGPQSTVMDLAAWDQGLAFGAAGPAFGLLDADGKRVLFRGPPMADLREKYAGHFLVSSDGRRARFGLKPFSQDPWLFDLAASTLVPSLTAPADLHPADSERLPVEGWKHTTELKLGGKALLLEQYERSRSLAIAPDAQSFVLGTEWALRRFDKDGKQLWEKPVPGTAWGVNLAREGRLILAAYGDGTIRWHRAADGEELLALFIHVPEDPKADKRWVLWTPEGYYTASPGAEDLIGWHVNRGPDQAADFYPAETFSSTFHKPDIVLKALDKAD
jgi:hypothetical protein